jgi:hypothetical protein
MRLRAGTLDRMIANAKKLWGIPEWDITWKFGALPHLGEIDMANYIEKRCVITFDEETVRKCTRLEVYRLVVHEVGHPILEPIERGVLDWVSHLNLNEEQCSIFAEMLNTRENEVLGHVMSSMMRV